ISFYLLCNDDARGVDHLRRTAGVRQVDLVPRQSRGNARACEQGPDAERARQGCEADGVDLCGARRREIGGRRQHESDADRARAAIVNGDVVMQSRNELDLAPRFPQTYKALHKIKSKEIIIDGEVVVLDDQGAPRFQLLQQGGNERMVIFDVLWLDGEDLRGKPYIERRALVEKLFRKPPAGIIVAQTLKMSGEKALQLAAK